MTIVAALAIALAAWGWLRPGADPLVLRYDLELPQSDRFQAGRVNRWLDVASDGTIVRVFLAPSPDGGPFGVMYLASKHPEEQDRAPVAGADSAWHPRISPDERRIAFLSHDRGIDIGYPHELRVVPAAGGGPVTVAEDVGTFEWLDDDRIVYSAWGDDRLYLQPASGGDARLLYELEGDSVELRYGLGALPGGRAFFFVRCPPPCRLPDHEVWSFDLRKGEARFVTPGVGAAYLSSGHLAYVSSSGTLFAARFDASTSTVSGDPVPVLSGIAVADFETGFSVSPGGALLLGLGRSVPPVASDDGRLGLAWLSRGGELTPIDPGLRFVEGETLGGMNLSPDGTRIAVSVLGDQGEDVWIKQLPDGPFYPLTSDPAADGQPSWTPDGEWVVYASYRDDPTATHLFRRRWDGTGSAEPFLPAARMPLEVSIATDAPWAVVRG